MNLKNIFSSTEISASGLAAERMRMEVAANNIANANSTRTASGGPFRRQQVVFEAALDDAQRRGASAGGSASHLKGVSVAGTTVDRSELPKVFNPGHPDANKDGFVEMPNIAIPIEMIDLMTASRAYEANLKSLQTFRQMAEQTLSLMRPMS